MIWAGDYTCNAEVQRIDSARPTAPALKSAAAVFVRLLASIHRSDCEHILPVGTALMKREARMLLQRSLDSLVLSIERFNCPWDRGRQEVMLLLLDRAFELLLKAAIIHKGGRIREAREKDSFGHEKCLRLCLSDKKVQCLTNEQALTIQVVNSLRDAAQHYMLQVSEQQLYIYAQAGVTLYSDLLKDVFGENLREHVPDRVLPVCTSPPKDLKSLVKAEFDDIKALVAPKSRKALIARAKIRALAVVEASVNGISAQPGEGELNALLRKVKQGKSWHEIFPGVASLELTTGSDESYTRLLFG